MARRPAAGLFPAPTLPRHPASPGIPTSLPWPVSPLDLPSRPSCLILKVALWSLLELRDCSDLGFSGQVSLGKPQTIT